MSTAETLAALRAWAETQPQGTQLIAETLADQVEELARAPDSELLHDWRRGFTRQAGVGAMSEPAIFISFGDGNAGKGKGLAFLQGLIGHTGDECVIWPFSRDDDGYGLTSAHGTLYRAHKLMCLLAHGRPPTMKHEAAHECGKGHEGCVNPRHLAWKTRSENALDMARHGTAKKKGGPRYKLTAEKVAEIRALKGQKTQREIAAMFGVKHKQISKIMLGQAWAT